MPTIYDDVLEIMTENEQLFVVQKPNPFPADLHSGKFLVLFTNLDWAWGGIFVERPTGVQEDTTHQKFPTFIYD